MRIEFGTIIYTLCVRLLLIIFLIFLAIPLTICLLSRKKFLVDNWLFRITAQIFYWFCIRFSFLPITYKGVRNIPKEPCIIVANHQSGFDIPLVGFALGDRPHLWLAWSELAKSPMLKFILPRVSILVDTTTPARGLRTLVQAINLIKQKPWDLIIFPEGSRNTDGTVKEFFGGFAVIAKKTGRPVVPIKIIGVNTVYPPHTFWIYYNPITVLIGKPMTIAHNETEEEFKQRVYQWFIDDSKEE